MFSGALVWFICSYAKNIRAFSFNWINVVVTKPTQFYRVPLLKQDGVTWTFTDGDSATSYPSSSPFEHPNIEVGDLAYCNDRKLPDNYTGVLAKQPSS